MLTVGGLGVPIWAEQGPGPILTSDGGGVVGTGAVVDVAAHPDDPFIVYAATAGGGVWRTRDAAAGVTPSWEPLTDGYPSMAMGAIAFSPADTHHQTLYAGTGSFSSFGPTGPAIGMYRTYDGGDTWKIVGANELTGRLIRHIRPLQPPNGNVVLVSTITNASSGGLFRSADGGDSFASISGNGTSGLPQADTYDLVEDPLYPGRVYVGVWGGSGGGVYLSTDAGQTWSPINTRIATADLQSIGWIRLALRAGRHGAASDLYAAIVTDAWNLANIYHAIALGGQESWTQIQPPHGGTGKIYTAGQSWKFALAADPQHPTLFVAADEGGVWRAEVSNPLAPRWTQISGDGVPHEDAQGFAFDANGDLIACNDGGVFRLEKPSTSPRWVPIGSTIRNDEPLSVAYDTLTDIVTVGAADNGVAYQANTGLPTFLSMLEGDGGSQGVDNGGEFISERYAVLVESAGLDTLTRYTFDAQNIETNSHHVDLANMPKDDHAQSGTFVVNNLPQYGERLLVGAIGLFESTDRGANVQEVLNLHANRPTGVWAMCYGSRDIDATPRPEVAYAGIGSQVWVRKVGAAQFTLTSYPGTGPIRHVAVDLHNWRRAYVLENQHVWFTPDAGTTWTECTGNLLQVATDAQGGTQMGQLLTYRTASSSAQEAVLVGGMGGIFRTLNPAAGTSAVWKKFGANLPGCFGQELKYYPLHRRAWTEKGDVLVASLQGRGAWTLANASQHLLQPPVLHVTASAPQQFVRVSLSGTIPGLLEVFDTLPGPGSPLFSVPVSAVERIVIRCVGDDNTLIVDSRHGHIPLPIDFGSSGTARNRIELVGGRAPNCQLVLRGARGEVNLGGSAGVAFSGVQQLDNRMPGGVFGVSFETAIDQLAILDGTPLDGIPSMTIVSRGGAREFRIQTTNQETVEITTVASAGQVQVTDFLQRPPALQHLLVRGGPTSNDIRIDSTPAGLLTQVEGRGGADHVTIGTLTGSAGNLDEIKGQIHVMNPGGATALVVDGSHNPQSVAAGVLDAGSLTGVAPASIQFDPAGVASLELAMIGGSLTVHACTVPTAIVGGSSITALDVHQTTAGLEFTCGSLVDRVTLGDGTLAALQGPVAISGSAQGNVNVVLNNSVDFQPRDVAIDAQSVAGFGSAPVSLVAGSGNPALNGLTIRSGTGRSTYTVMDTPALFTVALVGQGQDVVQAYGARQRMDIGGASAITLGSPTSSLDRFGGEVHIGVGASTTLTIDDRASAATRQGGMDASQLGGLTRFPLVYSAATLHALHVLFGAGQTAFTVTGSPAGASTSFALGSGSVHLNLQACTGPVDMTAAGGAHQVTLSSTAPDVAKGVLTTISAPIQLGSGSQLVDLSISEGGDTTPRTGDLSAATLAGLGLGSPVTFEPPHSLAVRLSEGGNTFECDATPSGSTSVLRTGGHDSVVVKLRPNTPCDLLVEGPQGSQDRLQVSVENAQPSQISHTPPAGATPGSVRVTRGGGLVQVVSYIRLGSVSVT
ncbi:MAG: hypothetical protein JOZ87_04240 [Chloroflexi bacterium]|nr:hypothetical protein [Chloroflexota bacterium]